MPELEPITWQNIPGLTDRERELGEMLFYGADLRTLTLASATVGDERIPDIRAGQVYRETDSHTHGRAG
ncbi:hypothetical protein [Microbacterium testaceum]|uniref:hypothetical protein n=1 Tax=Microbacterium testaceum TaxID=2033 RepID=UPI001D17273A|nr:hypothetical protein [Microbacterium testaceum]MCC4249526.1 hypothetical protein [Microbacterium testaceum]